MDSPKWQLRTDENDHEHIELPEDLQMVKAMSGGREVAFVQIGNEAIIYHDLEVEDDER